MMGRSFQFRAARFMAMVAVCLQVILPVAVPLAQAKGVDLSSLICAPYGQDLNAETRAAVLRLATLVDDETAPEPVRLDGHCPLCTLSHNVLLPQPVTVVEATSEHGATCVPPSDSGPVREAEGPPLGSRGPPTHF